MLFHLGDRELRDVIEARHVHVHHGGVDFGSLFGERLPDVDAGIVDQRIDSAEPRDAFGNHASDRRSIVNVAGNAENVVIVRWLDGT